MRLYRFDPHAGRPVSAFGSQSAAIAHIVRAGTACSAVAIHLEPGGVLGAHPAAQEQLFLVVAGRGRFRGEEGIRHDAIPGRAAFWRQGEVHETRAGHDGLTAVVLEGDGFGEAIVLPPWAD
jgi:quercetin dioxygenase-like cupin family protein